MWEDYINGMWSKLKPEDEIIILPEIVSFTGNHILYGKSMIRAVNEWPITCNQNLSNPDINQRAFIGHCGCCIEKGYPEYMVRRAWWMLSEEQRVLADKQADIAIKYWQDNYFKKQKNRTNAKNQIRIDGF